jgi:hypothetical protein
MYSHRADVNNADHLKKLYFPDRCADFTADQEQEEAQPELRHEGKEGKIRPQAGGQEEEGR